MTKTFDLVFMHQYDSIPVPLYQEGKVKPERLFPDQWYEKFEQADEATQKTLVQSRFKTILSDGTILKTLEGCLNAAKRHPNYFSSKNNKLLTDMHKLAVLVGLVSESTETKPKIKPISSESDESEDSDTVPIPAMDPKRLT